MQFIAGIGVDRSERPGIRRHRQVVLHGVAGQGGVVGLDVQLEVIHQAVGAEEIQARGRVGIILVRRRLLRLRFDVELPFEADLLFVIDGHVQERGEVVELALHVGVEQGGVPFAAAPERVALAFELGRHIHRLLYLRRRKGKNIRIRAGGRALLVARVGKKTGGAPEQFFPGVFLQLAEDSRRFVEDLVTLLERAPSRAPHRGHGSNNNRSPLCP